jgi:hypothetical protein
MKSSIAEIVRSRKQSTTSKFYGNDVRTGRGRCQDDLPTGTIPTGSAQVIGCPYEDGTSTTFPNCSPFSR